MHTELIPAPIPDRHDHVMRAYLCAKDEQRPHLLRRAFAEDATFRSQHNYATDFSDDTRHAEGLDAITATFRALGAACENIFTVSIPEGAAADGDEMCCRWLVGMQERRSGAVRIGWGSYRWRLRGDLAVELLVVMEQMVRIEPADPAHLQALDWLAALPAPWCPAQILTASAPSMPMRAEMCLYILGEEALQSSSQMSPSPSPSLSV